MTHENSFPLTEIQEAFYVGRTLGAGVGTQVQLEFEVDDLDVPRMEEAWNRLVRATDMLRVTVTPDAKQSVAAQVPHYRIEVTDLSFDLDHTDRGELLILITYRLRATNHLRNLVYPFYVIPAEESE